MKLIIARHAETVSDMHELSLDKTVNNILSDMGREQAEKLARCLREKSINYIYSSNTLRTMATTYLISDAMPEITIMMTKDLRTKDKGEDVGIFSLRIRDFIGGLQKKFDKENILLITHSDVISQIRLELLDKPLDADLAGISEFILDSRGKVNEIVINETLHLK